MKSIVLKVFVMLGIMSMVLSTSVQAMESDSKSQVTGVVVDISSAAIVIQEVREESNEISQFELAIDDKTQFSAEETGEIALGDAVEIEYTETEEGKLALMIQEISAKESGEKAAKKALKAELALPEK